MRKESLSTMNRKVFLVLLAVLFLNICFTTSTFGDGKCVEGDCENGKGTMTWTDGDKYVGEYKDGKTHGQGTYTWANGNKYVGEFKDDKRHGQGTYTWANGDKYVGEYKDDKRLGQGTYTWANGDKYVGEFKDNREVGGWYYWIGNTKAWSYKDSKGNWVHE